MAGQGKMEKGGNTYSVKKGKERKAEVHWGFHGRISNQPQKRERITKKIHEECRRPTDRILKHIFQNVKRGGFNAYGQGGGTGAENLYDRGVEYHNQEE